MIDEKGIIAVEITGKLVNQNESTLSTGEYDRRAHAMRSYDYPPGQTIRGALGYLFMAADLAIIKSYEVNAEPVLFFKDALPYHRRDGGILYPIITPQKYINYECQECKEILRYATFKSVITRTRIDRHKGTVSMMWRQEGITRKESFRFKVIVKFKKDNEENMAAVMTVLGFVEENGIALGKRSMKGSGRLQLEDLSYKPVNKEEIEKRAAELGEKKIIKVRLLSEAIVREKGTNLTTIPSKNFLWSVKNAAKNFNYGYKNYVSPEARLINYETTRAYSVGFLDIKLSGGQPEIAVPKGSMFSYKIERSAPEEFYFALALLERCHGIGNRASSGKGEIIIE
jgi:hypothetical protein